MKPTLGRTIIARHPELNSNSNGGIAPAIITQTFGNETKDTLNPEDTIMVNAKGFPPGKPPVDLFSIRLVHTQDDADNLPDGMNSFAAWVPPQA